MQDILINEDYELMITNGDFTVGVSDQQQQNLLLICNKGSFKETPAGCVGLWNYLEAEDPADLIREIKSQFSGDGMEVDKIEFINGKLAIDAFYK